MARLLHLVALVAAAGCGSSAAHHGPSCQGFGVEVIPSSSDGGTDDVAALARDIAANVDGAACQTLFGDRVRCATPDTVDGCGLSSPADAQALSERISTYLATAWPALVSAGNPVVDSCFCEAF